MFSSVPLMLLFLGLFLIAEATDLNLEIRRHGLSVTLTEIPLVLALFYLSPLSLLTVRIAAMMVVQAQRRSPTVKLAFNVANIVAGNAAALLIVYAFGPLVDTSPRSWLVIYAAVGAAVLSTVAAVIGVISLIQGGMSTRRGLRTGTAGLGVRGIHAPVGPSLLVGVRRGP